MMKHLRAGDIPEGYQQVEGVSRLVQFLQCTTPGCECRLELPMVKDRKPPVLVFKIARDRGWRITESKRVYLCPEHAKGPRMTTTKEELRQPTREQRRAIFREIDENYAGRCYVSGVTDKTIGEKLKCPWAWVAAVREENFGPAGLDPVLQAAVTKVEELEAKIAKMETEALAAFEGSVRQIGDVAEQLKAVRASLLKFAS